MRKILFLAIVCMITTGLYSQTTLFTESWESGVGNWIIANHTDSVNKWSLGVATATGTGTHSMYISNDNGTTNAYTVNQPVVAHVYRDIAIPSNVTNIVLNFDIKCQGQMLYDYARVYMMPIDVTPEAAITSYYASNTTNPRDPNFEYLIGLNRYNASTLQSYDSDIWNNVDINIPPSWSGETGRLVFSWINNNSSGTQPPVAIDNISIRYESLATQPSPATLVSPGHGAVYVNANTSLVWAADEFSPQPTGYTVYLDESPDPVTIVYTGSETVFTPETPLNWSTTYYWKVVPANEYGSATDCPIWLFTTNAENTLYIGGEMGGLSVSYAPLRPDYYFTVSQTIYTEEELALTFLDRLYITHISFQAHSMNINLESYLNNNWLICMGTTEQNVFSSNANESWISLESLTPVRRGAISSAVLQSYEWITIELDTPYLYAGSGNLVIFVNEYIEGNTGTLNNAFSGTTGSEYRTYYRFANGSSPFIPEGTRDWNDGEGGGGGRSQTRPNIMIRYVEADSEMGIVSGIVDDGSGLLVGVSVAVTGTIISTITDNAGEYTLEIEVASESSITFTKEGYETVSFLISDLEWEGEAGHQTAVCDVHMVAESHSVTVTGSITRANGSLAGFEVTFTNQNPDSYSPPNDTTDDAGFFSFVVPRGEYILTAYLDGVSLDGIPYTMYTSEPIAVDGDMTLDPINMTPHSENEKVISPAVTTLAGNYPNPFNPTTIIAFDMARSGHVSVEVFNIRGQKVRVLVSDVLGAGRHSVVWNGDDATGRSVGSGVYFYRMSVPGYTSVKKMLLMK